MKSAHPESDSQQNPNKPNFGINREEDQNIEKCFSEPGIFFISDKLLQKSIQKVLSTEVTLTLVSVSVTLFAFAIKYNPGQVILILTC